MLLICPNCAARYEVDGSKFPAAGRKVRCAKCGTTWHQSADAAPEPDQAEIEAVVFEGRDPEPAAPAPEPEPQLEPEVTQEEPEQVWRAPPVHAERDEESFEDAPKPKAKKRGGGVLVAFGWVALIAVVLLIGFAAASFRTAPSPLRCRLRNPRVEASLVPVRRHLHPADLVALLAQLVLPRRECRVRRRSE